MSLSAGAMLGPYEILTRIGAGGMGEVWKARDTRLDRAIAIKTSKAQFSERFAREAKAIAALNHPHICQLYDVGPDYLVMEYVEGSPLKGPLAVEKAVEYAGQILSALDAAHRKGITHRDLKPANIILTKQHGIKLLDFGLARIAAGSGDSTLTQPGEKMGTPAYMSPEQWEGKPGDARTDIYCFGCVLYELITGKRAAQEGRPPVKSAPLEGVIATCLRTDPEERWQSARDIRGMLALPTPPVPKARPLWPGIAWTVAGVLALLAIALGTALWRSAPRPIEQPAVRMDLDLGSDVSLGSTTGPAVILSPDGTRLVFVSQGPDRVPHLFTRPLDQPKASPLAKTEGAYAPFFSLDGQWVGFFAQGKLKKTRIDGGEPVTLCDAPAGRGASWGEDDNIIAALDTQTVLSQVPSAGGKAVSFTNFSLGETTHRWPQVLPGGKAVLFTASITNGNFDEAGIAVVSLKDHRRKTLLEHAGMYPRYLPSGHLVYVTKGTLFAVPFDLDRLEVRGPATLLQELAINPVLGFGQFDFSRSGTLAYRTGGTEWLKTIQWLDGVGKTESLLAEPALYGFPKLSPDGSRLAYLVNLGSSADLWIYDLQRGSKTRLTSDIVALNTVWSPDGRFVVFQSPGGTFWTRADGAGRPQPLTQSKTGQFPTSFTPDGRWLVFSEQTPAGTEIRTVQVESGSGQMRAGEPQLFLKTSTVNAFATFSPDGRWLAYGDAESGRFEVYVRAFPDNGAKVQISNAGGMMPVWSRNGHELFYRTEDNRIMVANYTVKGGSFVADKPRVWFGKQLANLGTGLNFELAPDGKRFVVLMPADSPEPRETQSHVTLVVNFFDEIRRRVAVAGKN